MLAVKVNWVEGGTDGIGCLDDFGGNVDLLL